MNGTFETREKNEQKKPIESSKPKEANFGIRLIAEQKRKWEMNFFEIVRDMNKNKLIIF